MDWSHTRSRFAFLAEALNAEGGFSPLVRWVSRKGPDGAAQQVPELMSPCRLHRHTREAPERYAARAAVAVYINHLSTAVGRFGSFLSRRRPMRGGVDGPLAKLLVADADMRGSSLDDFMMAFHSEAKARGSMLLVIDMPTIYPAGELPGEPAVRSMADQLRMRAIPFLRWVPPEYVDDFEVDGETGLFKWVEVKWSTVRAGKMVTVRRRWDMVGCQEFEDDQVVAASPHPFGETPVFAFTEGGALFPKVGRYAQIADLSLRLFNARSERDAILRDQTFSVLAYPVPPDAWQQWVENKDLITATIGTHSMLVYMGDQPNFIAPPSGPVEAYTSAIHELEEQIRVISHADATADGKSVAESGLARKMRFEALNAELAESAKSLQRAEMWVWRLFDRAVRSGAAPSIEYPSDYNLADVIAELEILQLMQSTGFPPEVLQAKRRSIVAVEFDGTDEETKAQVLQSVSMQAQEDGLPGAGAGDEEDPSPT